MQTLEVFQSLWAMTHSAEGASKWTLPEQVKMIHAAGKELTDRWQEALAIKAMVEKIWLDSEPAV